MWTEMKQNLVAPTHIVSTQLSPYLILWSNPKKVAYFVEIKVPCENRVEEANELLKARYPGLMGEAAQRGWSARLRPVEVGGCGVVAGLTVS